MDLTEAAYMLGIPVDSSVEDARKAHRRIVKSVHPDVGGSGGLFDACERALGVFENGGSDPRADRVRTEPAPSPEPAYEPDPEPVYEPRPQPASPDEDIDLGWDEGEDEEIDAYVGGGGSGAWGRAVHSFQVATGRGWRGLLRSILEGLGHVWVLGLLAVLAAVWALPSAVSHQTGFGVAGFLGHLHWFPEAAEKAGVLSPGWSLLLGEVALVVVVLIVGRMLRGSLLAQLFGGGFVLATFVGVWTAYWVWLMPAALVLGIYIFIAGSKEA